MIMAELTLLIENKKELVDHLNDILVDQILQELQTIYDETRKTLSIHESNSKLLKIFQDKLTHIPEWSKEQKLALYERVQKSTGITYLNELIQGILGTQIKIIIKTENPDLDIPKIKFRIPSTENFIHMSLIVAARSIWKQTYLMYHNVRNLEKQHNIAQLEEIIRKSLSSAIRSCLPLDHLFKYIQENTQRSYEEEDDHEIEEDEEDDEIDEDEEDDEIEEDEEDDEIEEDEEDDDEIEEDEEDDEIEEDEEDDDAIEENEDDSDRINESVKEDKAIEEELEVKEEELEVKEEELEVKEEELEIIKNEVILEKPEEFKLEITKTQSIEELEKELEKELDDISEKKNIDDINEIKLKAKQLPLRIVPLNIRNEIIRQKKLKETNIIPKKTDAFF